MLGKGTGLPQSPSAEPQADHPDLSAGGKREEDPRGEKRKQACGGRGWGASFLSLQIPWVASSARHQAWPALTEGPGWWERALDLGSLPPRPPKGPGHKKKQEGQEKAVGPRGLALGVQKQDGQGEGLV